MNSEQDNNQIVFTNKARCRDCYRCIRLCPVKAIGLHDGQAYVDPEKCISCGTCIRECPQYAKSFRNDLDRVTSLITTQYKTAVTLAPSFASFFEPWQIKRLPSALRKLGFFHVSETAVGAYYVAQETSKYIKEHPKDIHITTACPAVVNYIELYKPELVKYLVPIVSPMNAHGRMLRKKFGGDISVVFIGPCVAKKHEIQKTNDIDYVLTFLELEKWFETENINLEEFEESDFDEIPKGWARNFPLAGGALQTGLLSTDMLDKNVISVSGIDDINDIFNTIGPDTEPVVIEPLFCEQGCINGPAIVKLSDHIFNRRKAIINYTNKNPGNTEAGDINIALDTVYLNKHISDKNEIPDSEITKILAMTGKENPEDQLNCGACGYPSCRQQAIAVIKGMASIDMCIPYMRRLAERRTDRIIETSPNGIVILDEHLDILSMNDSFKKLFMCSKSLCGKRISYLMDPEPFELLASGKQDITEMTVQHANYNLICHQIIYALREEKQYVGIFVNMTNSMKNKKQLDEIKAKTVIQARNLLNHQMSIAGQIAQFLGESAAENEKLLENLTQLVQEEPDNDSGGKPWTKTYT